MASNNCKHCGENIPEERKDGFCCAGCAGAYTLIHDLGMEAYYTHQHLQENTQSLKPEERPDVSWFAPYVLEKEEGRHQIHLLVEGLHCAACVWLIEQVLRQEKGVESVHLNMSTHRLKIVWQARSIGLDELLAKLYQLGYKAHPFDPDILKSKDVAEEKELLTALAIAGFAAGNVMIYSVCVWAGVDMSDITRQLFGWISALIALPTVAFSGRIFFKSAWQALKGQRVNMDVPISLAVILATLLSLYELVADSAGHTYFDGAVTLLFFLLIGRYLDRITRHKAHRRTAELLLADDAFVNVLKEENEVTLLPMKKLKVGDVILLPKGARLGVDVHVLSAEGWVDTSAITGEGAPLAVHAKDFLAAGFVNLGESLTCKVSAVGEKSTLHHIMQTIESAESIKNSYTRWADKAASLYTPAVHLFAFVTFMGWLLLTGNVYQGIVAAIAVLIVTCPCAFALAVPSAMVAAQNALMGKGVFIKDSRVLEKLNGVVNIVFDKTGTLTAPQWCTDKLSKRAQGLAIALAKHSQHPLSQMIVSSAPTHENLPKITAVKEISGKGIQGMFEGEEVRLGSATYCKVPKGEGLFLRQGNVCEPIHFTEALKPDAVDTLTALKHKGYRVHLATGDRKALLPTIEALPFDHILRQQTPEEKQAFVKKCQQEGRVMMVGDGLNDSPALALADVSVSFGEASALAQSTADVILCRSTLVHIPYLLQKSHHTKRIVVQNFGFSLAYNSFAIPLAMLGYMTPMWAAIFMSTSSLCVMLNALRLRGKNT